MPVTAGAFEVRGRSCCGEEEGYSVLLVLARQPMALL